MSNPVEDMLNLLASPLIAVAVVIGEAAAADAHLDMVVANGVLEEIALAMERAEVGEALTSATAVWAVRRCHSGDLTAEQAEDPEAIIADARSYATEHPGELAEYDQLFAEFIDDLRGRAQ